MRALGDGRDVETVLKQNRNGQACDRTGCLFEIDTHAEKPLQVATVNRVEAMFEACMGDAGLIISSLYKTPPCPFQPTIEKVVIDKSFLAARGSVVLSTIDRASAHRHPIDDSVSKGLHELGLMIETSLPIRKRLWN